ncbi:MAG: metallophosphoesterase family protein [Planctomycetota bacterium]|jgi:diadenosine tetraphosphatase ApaH/serine/threonine PP2A family protein phosphatase
MIAIVSDIHGNLEALTAVLQRCDELGVTDILCLGDIIGYGPDPIAVTKLAIQRFRVSLMGNHEAALITGEHRFNPYATQAIDWTREQLRQASTRGLTSLFGKGDGTDLLSWYGKLKPFHLEGRRLLVHGSIYDPVHDYVDEPENPIEAERMIATLDRDFAGFELCFAGHNHTPFVATKLGTLFPHDGHSSFVIPEGHRAYICVGSVGQPRDWDWRASFATLDGDRITYHRLEYDIKTTQQKILDAGLHHFLAERLEQGC